jgi:hypothetical protein
MVVEPLIYGRYATGLNLKYAVSTACFSMAEFLTMTVSIGDIAKRYRIN